MLPTATQFKAQARGHPRDLPKRESRCGPDQIFDPKSGGGGLHEGWWVTVRGSIRRGARAVHARCGYWGCSVDPFIQSQSGGMVTPQSPAGTIYNSSPRRPSPGEVVQIPDAVRARCARGACAVRILPLSTTCVQCHVFCVSCSSLEVGVGGVCVGDAGHWELLFPHLIVSRLIFCHAPCLLTSLPPPLLLSFLDKPRQKTHHGMACSMRESLATATADPAQKGCAQDVDRPLQE